MTSLGSLRDIRLHNFSSISFDHSRTRMVKAYGTAGLLMCDQNCIQMQIFCICFPFIFGGHQPVQRIFKTGFSENDQTCLINLRKGSPPNTCGDDLLN